MNPLPRDIFRHIVFDSRGDDDLFVCEHGTHEPLATPGIELREDIIENNDRIAGERLLLHNRGETQSECKCEGPRFAVTRESFDRQIIEFQHEIVSVGTDEGHPAVELLLTHLLEGSVKGLDECFT